MLEARGLTKCYSSIPAVKDVTFRIEPGQILGYLGPNGSGKSTTVKMLTGLLEPTRGQVLYQGRSVRTDLVAYKRRLGYIPEEANLYPHLTGYEYLELVGLLRGIDERLLARKIDEFLTLFGLFQQRHTPAAAYSKGMRQKLLISAALIHDPDILILDEPEAGLDVTTSLVLRKLIARLATEGKVVLYSSHVLEVVEKVCSHVLLLHKGNVVAHESIEGMRHLASKPSLEHVFSELTNQTDTDVMASELVGTMRLK
jgi:ABC-2 type transport system ATP-binding protein